MSSVQCFESFERITPAIRIAGFVRNYWEGRSDYLAKLGQVGYSTVSHGLDE